MSFWNFAGALGGALLSGNLGQSGARQQMRFNAQQAQLNRDFQERMSSTAHQRQVADLRKAGLNPILSASQGGAQTPSGGQASTSLNPLEHAAHSAANLNLMKAQAKKLNAEANKIDQNVQIDKPSEQVFGSFGNMLESAIGSAKDWWNNSAKDVIINPMSQYPGDVARQIREIQNKVQQNKNNQNSGSPFPSVWDAEKRKLEAKKKAWLKEHRPDVFKRKYPNG